MEYKTRKQKELKDMTDEELLKLSCLSEHRTANILATIGTTILCGIIIITYLAVMVMGLADNGIATLVLILAIAPLLLCWILFRRNRETKHIRDVIGVGFSLVYIVILFTSEIETVFLYSIPLLIIVTLFCEVWYIAIVGCGCAAVNLIYVITRFAKGTVSEMEASSLPMRVVMLSVIALFLIIVTATSRRFQEIRSSRLILEQRKIKGLLDEILKVSGKMTGTVENMAGEMNFLQESVDQTITSMNEVSQGTAESATAVQNQMIKTEEIQNHIGEVEKAAEEISGNINATTQAVAEGQKHIKELDQLAAQVDNAGKDVASALESFNKTASQMNSITDLISNVANQTSLLALNASIEAARAGEAGRGFAVVASEISNLAGQTTTATADINKLIGEISAQSAIMVETIEKLLQIGEQESKCAELTAQSFKLITNSVEEIDKHSAEMTRTVSDLAKANSEIVSSIETISAITQEVTAHASTTYSGSEENSRIVGHINELMSELSSDATELKSYI